MQQIDYSASAYPVRETLIDSQEAAWRKLAEPGAFLDGARRVAVARETRHAEGCALCQRRKEALSPFAIDGTHDATGALTDTETEVVHRLTTDSGRLSRKWLAGILDSGLAEEDYIEIVSIVAIVKLIDAFRFALDLPPFDLPEPVAGEPSGYAAPGAKMVDGWTRLVLPEDVSPGDGNLYWGRPPSPVVKSLSLVPHAKHHYWELAEEHYLPSDQMLNFKTDVRAIDRMQMELIASRVAALHQCLY